MSYDIQRLLPRHFAIMDLALIGHDYAGIAKTLNMSPQTVTNVVNSPIFQHEMARRREEQNGIKDETVKNETSIATRMLHEASVRAVSVHEELLDDSDKRIRQTSASKILEYTFGKSGQDKSQPGGPQTVVIISDAALAGLTKVLAESGIGTLVGQPSVVKQVEATVVHQIDNDASESTAAA